MYRITELQRMLPMDHSAEEIQAQITQELERQKQLKTLLGELIQLDEAADRLIAENSI